MELTDPRPGPELPDIEAYRVRAEIDDRDAHAPNLSQKRNREAHQKVGGTKW